MSTNKGAFLSEESGEDWKFSSFISIERCISTKWILEKFSLRPTDTMIWSPSFTFLSFKWSLGLHPGTINVCVELDLRMENPKSKIKVKCKMCLKDRNDDRCVVNFEYVFSAEKRTFSCSLITRSELLKRREELLCDDVLTVYCEISATHNVDRGVDRSTTTEAEVLAVPKCIQVFMNDVGKLLKDHKSSDVTLRVGDKEFPAHKLLLGARSNVFAAMFEHDTEESRSGIVTITDIDMEIVSDLLQYIYSGKVKDMSVETAIGLYCAAEKYALLDLKDQCAYFLRKNLSEENICDIALMADAHNDGMLVDSVKVFIHENTSILFSEHWKRLITRNAQLACEFNMSLLRVLLSDKSVPNQ